MGANTHRSIVLFIILISFCLNELKGQEDVMVKKDSVAYSLEEALKSPEDILILDLSKQKIKELPNDFGPLINLRELYLDKNKLSSLPRSLASCEQLQIISISKNKFVDFPMIICYLSQLKSLDFSTNEIAALPDCLAELIHLEYIYLVGNEIAVVPEKLEKLNLKELDMRMIQMNEKEQNTIREQFPNTDIKFSKPCNCFETNETDEAPEPDGEE
jgi:Leucine-rich repeat (LRR) protein